MDTKNDRTPSEQPQSDKPQEAPKKRFHIEKLEERIAPGKGNATKKGCSSISGSIDTGSSSSLSY